jgi:hypothetical protein
MYKLEKADIPSEALAELERVVASVKWRESTTYPPEMQHAYILRKDVPEAFAALEAAIAKYGFMDEFAGRPQVYLVMGRYKYWAYDTVLNREDVQLTLARQAQRSMRGGAAGRR